MQPLDPPHDFSKKDFDLIDRQVSTNTVGLEGPVFAVLSHDAQVTIFFKHLENGQNEAEFADRFKQPDSVGQFGSVGSDGLFDQNHRLVAQFVHRNKRFHVLSSLKSPKDLVGMEGGSEVLKPLAVLEK
jgi:hypothetical protein